MSNSAKPAETATASSSTSQTTPSGEVLREYLDAQNARPKESTFDGEIDIAPSAAARASTLGRAPPVIAAPGTSRAETKRGDVELDTISLHDVPQQQRSSPRQAPTPGEEKQGLINGEGKRSSSAAPAGVNGRSQQQTRGPLGAAAAGAQTSAATAPQTPKDPVVARAIQRRQLVVLLAVLAVVFTVVLLAIARFPFGSDNAAAEAPTDMHLLSALCPSSAPSKADLTQRFVLLDTTTNQTHSVYVHLGRGVEVTDIVQDGRVVYTEMQDADSVIVFEHGRNDGLSRPDSCSSRPRDPARDLSWVALACRGEPVWMGERMRALQGVTPTYLSESLFDLPTDCRDDTDTVHDATHTASARTHLDTYAHATPDPAAMLQNSIGLMEREYGGDYARIPTLAQNLVRAYNRLAVPQWNATAKVFFSAHAPNATIGADACCLGFEPCLETPLTQTPTCAEYVRCLNDNAPAPACAAGTDERECRCSQAYAAALDMPGKTQCDSCLEDEAACECHVIAWGLRNALAQQPCSCVGVCARPLHPHLCRAERVCPSPVATVMQDASCYWSLEWCAREQEFVCSKCHLSPSDHVGLDAHC